MTTHTQTFTFRPVPLPWRLVYLRRGLSVPESIAPAHRWAALVTYWWRAFHRRYATRHGYFWIPCPLCKREYGGHEIRDFIPDPTLGEGFGIGICPRCTAARNGGRP